MWANRQSKVTSETGFYGNAAGDDDRFLFSLD